MKGKRGKPSFWVVMVWVAVAIVIGTFFAYRVATELQQDFCVKQGFADVETVLGRSCCVGYRDGELVVVPISILEEAQ